MGLARPSDCRWAWRGRRTDVQRYQDMIPVKRPVGKTENRRIFGAEVLATAAGTAAAVATRTAGIADLGALLGEPRLHRRVTGALEPDLEVLRGLRPLDLTPSVGEQVFLASCRGLAQRVAARHLDVEPLVDDLSIVGHRRTRVAGGRERPGDGRAEPFSAPRRGPMPYGY